MQTIPVNAGHEQPIGLSHKLRRVAWEWALLVLGLLIVAVTVQRFWTSSDQASLTELMEFRAAVADQCDLPEFNAPASYAVRDLYLRAPKVREGVTRASQALQNGASCDMIMRILSEADYPHPAHPPRSPLPAKVLER